MKCFLLVLLAVTFLGQLKRSSPLLPLRNPTNTFNTSDISCRSSSLIDKETAKIKELLDTKYFFHMDCGGSGWERVAYYNFSQQECPSEFIRPQIWKDACSPGSNTSNNRCEFFYRISSIKVPVRGRSYSSVSGRARGHGGTWSFRSSVLCSTSLERGYVYGVSITHGSPGNRRHIWTFAAAHSDGGTHALDECPCSSINTWPYSVPAFVGQDYFCENFYSSRGGNSFLWDGKGCGPTSTCCVFNNPPYFCKHLDYITSDDIEIRLISTSVSFIEIYIK